MGALRVHHDGRVTLGADHRLRRVARLLGGVLGDFRLRGEPRRLPFFPVFEQRLGLRLGGLAARAQHLQRGCEIRGHRAAGQRRLGRVGHGETRPPDDVLLVDGELHFQNELLLGRERERLREHENGGVILANAAEVHGPAGARVVIERRRDAQRVLFCS